MPKRKLTPAPPFDITTIEPIRAPPPSWYPGPAAPAGYRPATPVARDARVAEPADDCWQPPERALGDGRTLVLDADPIPDWLPV